MWDASFSWARGRAVITLEQWVLLTNQRRILLLLLPKEEQEETLLMKMAALQVEE
jgi:hypothetical protein